MIRDTHTFGRRHIMIQIVTTFVQVGHLLRSTSLPLRMIRIGMIITQFARHIRQVRQRIGAIVQICSGLFGASRRRPCLDFNGGHFDKSRNFCERLFNQWVLLNTIQLETDNSIVRT